MKTMVYIKEIKRRDASDIIKRYHYLGDRGYRSKHIYGLFLTENDTMIGVCVYHDVSAPETVVGGFGMSRDEQNGILELGRFVLVPDINIPNVGSYFISQTLKEIKKMGYKYVISYASSDRHHGYLYQASNWKYYGLSDEKKDFYIFTDGKLIKQERGKTKNICGAWLERPRKHRYAYKLNGNMKINWVEEPYPKGDNKFDEDCPFCNKTKIVVDSRTNKQYNCPCTNGE